MERHRFLLIAQTKNTHGYYAICTVLQAQNHAITLMAARVLSFRKRKLLLSNQYVHDLYSNVRVWATSV